MTTDRFIAAFYMIDAQRMQALNQLYKEIYPNNNKREKKSNSVSDRINRKALEVAKPFLTSALILERPACDFNQFTDIKELMFFHYNFYHIFIQLRRFYWNLKNASILHKLKYML